MIIKKIHFPIFIFALILTLYSCTKKEKVANKTYTNFIEKATTFNKQQQYDSAYYYFNQARLSCSDDEKERIVYTLYNTAVIQQLKCDYSGSEATATEAIKIHPEYQHIVSFYNLLGLAYQNQFDYLNALKYYNLCLAKTKDEKETVILKNNIGYVLLELNNYQKAATVLKQIMSNQVLLADKLNYAKVVDNYGYALYKLSNPAAINYFTQSLKIRDSIKNDFELIPSYIHLSEYYQKSNPSVSETFAVKAYTAATKTNSPEERILSLKYSIQSANTTQVKALALKQMKLSDSINKVRQASKTQFAKIKYDVSIAQKESEKQRTEKQLYLLLFLFASTIFSVIFLTIRSRSRRKLRTISYETETRISKRLHDELANDVFNALTYAETQDLQDSAKKEQLLENLDAIYTRTRNIAKENSDIDTGTNYQDNLQSTIASYSSNEVNVIIQNTNTINWLSVKKEVKIAVYRTLQELLVNMKKHSQCSVVVIRFESTKKHITINYSDNGIGTSEMLKFKNGLQNAENRILAIKGTLTFETESGKGFKAQISVPE